MSVDAALASVRAQRSGAQPNAGFMRQLVDYEASLGRLPQAAAPQGVAAIEQGLKHGHHVCATRRDGVPHGAVTVAAAALSSDRARGESTREGENGMCSVGKSQLGSDKSRSVSHAAAAAGPSARGLVIDTCDSASAGKQAHTVDQSPASPRRLCGASFLAAHCGGEDTEAAPDPTPSPQSSAGDYDSYQSTPSCAAFVPAGWGVPAFSLIDGFPTLPSSQERASA